MTAKKAKFQMIGTVVNHPDFKGQDLNRGDILTLEVGDDGLPTSDLFRTRAVPVGREVENGDEGMSDKDAKAKAKGIIDDAKAKASDIIAKANTDAQAITDKANADAAELIEAATQK